MSEKRVADDHDDGGTVYCSRSGGAEGWGDDYELSEESPTRHEHH